MHLNRILFLSFVLFSTITLASLAGAQNAARSKAKGKKAADDCKNLPFAYDHGPYGQGSWCGICVPVGSTEERHQAPINIGGAQQAAMAPIEFQYDPNTPLLTLENANNLKVEGKGFIHIANFGDFVLKEFHFHRPSEEAIGNHRSAMVIHLVHQNKADPTKFAVVAVLVEEGDPAPDTAQLIDTLIRHFPPPLGLDPGTQINPTHLLPQNRSQYYRFDGSLTTPPCSPGITFFLLKQPISLSAEQIRQFARRYPLANARDLQDINGREILKNFPD